VIAPITVIAILVTIVTVRRTVTRRMGTAVVASLMVVEVESSVTALEEAETGIFVSVDPTPIVTAARFVAIRIAPLMVSLMGGVSLPIQILVSVSMMMTVMMTSGVTTPSTAFSLATVLIATVAFAGKEAQEAQEAQDARLLRESARMIRVKRIRSSSKRRRNFLDKRAAVMIPKTVPVVSIARTRKVIATLLSRGI